MDLLDTRAIANVVLPPAILGEEARIFLAERTDAFARGLAITVRATTNALASQPLIGEVFKQLSPAAGFEVALEAIENMSPSEMELLANQTAGGLILDALDNALSHGPTPTPQPFVDRLTGVRARFDQFLVHILNDPPSNVPSRAEKTVSVDTVKVDGSRFTPSTQVQVANAIYAQCNVRFSHGVDKTAPATFLGTDNKFQAVRSCTTHTKEELALFNHARNNLGEFGGKHLPLHSQLGFHARRHRNAGVCDSHLVGPELRGGAGAVRLMLRGAELHAADVKGSLSSAFSKYMCPRSPRGTSS